jgi:hypothetical protein
MPAIAAFIKGTVSESLTKLLQPAGLVPATFFVLMNLAFVYPSALDEKVRVAKTFSKLDPVWQTTTVAVLILAIGYLLLNSANTITETLSGENWRGSPLYGPLTFWQSRRRNRLLRRRDNASEDENRTELSWRLAVHFPPSESSHYLAPTQLGNVLAATQYTLSNRYGIDLASLWGPLEATSTVKDAPALAAVKDEKSTLDLLANIIFILILFTFEGLVFFGLRGRWDAVLLSLLALPVAYLAYRVAVRAARTWGDSVIVAFDLHRGDLRKALGLREPAGSADERKLWDEATAFYLPGAEDADASGIFDATPPSLSVSAPATLKVTPVSSSVVDTDGKPDGGRIVLRQIDYVLLVARAGEPSRFADADVVVSDPRVVELAEADMPQPVRHGLAAAKVRAQEYHGGLRLIWEVSRLERGASLTLDYKLPLWKLEVTPEGGLPTSAAPDGANGFKLDFPSSAFGTGLTLTLTALTPTDPLKHPRLCLGSEQRKLRPQSENGRIYKSEKLTLTNASPGLWLVLP